MVELKFKPKKEQKPSSILLRDLYRKSEKEPRKCVICGSEFTPKTYKSVTCGKQECSHERQKQKANKKAERRIQESFSKGRIYVLDMEKWAWKKEEREANKND